VEKAYAAPIDCCISRATKKCRFRDINTKRTVFMLEVENTVGEAVMCMVYVGIVCMVE
jgi:hypothetical protein